VNRSRIGLRQAKILLGQLVKEVRAGYEIVITDRGNPVAKLVPVGDLPLEARVRELEKRGTIGPLAGRRLPPPLPLAGNAAQRLLQEDRGGE
jgi:prevent-host-death family protein